MAQEDLVGRIGDRLVRRGTGPGHRPRLDTLREQRHQGDLARRVRREDGGDHRPEGQEVDRGGVEIGAVDELRDRELPELDHPEMLEEGARFGEGGTDAIDDGDPTAGLVRQHP